MSASEIAAYITLFLEQAPSRTPVLHLVMPKNSKRDRVVEALLYNMEGGHVVDLEKNKEGIFSFEVALGLLKKNPNLILVGAVEMRDAGVNPEALRQEVALRKGVLGVVTETKEGLEEFSLEATPRDVVRVVVNRTEVRVAPLSDEKRGWISIPQSGGRPTFVSTNAHFGRKVSEVAGEIINEAKNVKPEK